MNLGNHYALLAGFALGFANLAHAQSASQRQRLFDRAIAQPVTVAWEEQRIGHALARLAQLYDVPVWIDRRVDPSEQFSLALRQQPLAEAIQAVATQCGLGVAFRAGIVYVGPDETARDLGTLLELGRESLDKASSVRRRRWLTPANFGWPRLAEPRAIIERVAARLDAEVVGADEIPHDVWPERSPLTIAPIDLAVLILAGFDLTCRIDAGDRKMHVAPIARPVALTRSYSLIRVAPARVDQLARTMQRSSFERTGGRLTLTAPIEEHERVRTILRGKASMKPLREMPQATGKKPTQKKRSPAQRAYTLQIENQPVGRVVAQLARQLSLRVRWEVDDEAQRHLVSCEVNQASLDKLLAAVLEPAGLRFDREEDDIVIRHAR